MPNRIDRFIVDTMARRGCARDLFVFGSEHKKSTKPAYAGSVLV